MLNQSKKVEKKYEDLLQQAVRYVENGGFEEIKTKLEGYDDPHSFSQKKKENTYVPDISAKKSDSKYYFEVAQKTDNVSNLVSKWKLLATLAEMKNGSLNILVPSGYNKFTEELVEQYDIKAKLIKMV